MGREGKAEAWQQEARDAWLTEPTEWHRTRGFAFALRPRPFPSLAYLGPLSFPPISYRFVPSPFISLFPPRFLDPSHRSPPSFRSPSFSLEVAAREKKPPRLCSPFSCPLSPPLPRGSHGPVSLARSAHEHSGSCLVPSTRVALSLCPLPSPRVISHSLALACVRAHISVYTRWTAPGSREKKTRCVQCIYIYIVHVERNYIDPIYTIYISPIVKSIVTSLHPNDLPVNRFQRQIDLCIVALTSLLVSSRDSPMFASTHNYI